MFRLTNAAANPIGNWPHNLRLRRNRRSEGTMAHPTPSRRPGEPGVGWGLVAELITLQSDNRDQYQVLDPVA